MLGYNEGFVSTTKTMVCYVMCSSTMQSSLISTHHTEDSNPGQRWKAIPLNTRPLWWKECMFMQVHIYIAPFKMSKSQLIAVLVKSVGSMDTRVSDILLVNNTSQTTTANSRNGLLRLMNLDATTPMLHMQRKQCQWHKNNSATSINRRLLYYTKAAK